METTEGQKKIVVTWETRATISPNLYNESEEIKRLVAFEMLSTVEEMESKSRVREHVIARQLAMYFIRKKTILPLKAIGGLLGGRDHSTVLHAMQQVEDLRDSDKNFRRQFEYLQSLIG